MSNKYKIALVGNQNCGKSTLFNHLTNSDQHVGNFPGVTVSYTSAFLAKNKNIEVVDLPGIYSLCAYSEDEEVSIDYILKQKVDLIVNVVDVTNLARNLYLTTQLLETGIKMILVLNFMDEFDQCGNIINLDYLENKLHIPVYGVSAHKNQGLTKLVNGIINKLKDERSTLKVDFCQSGYVHVAIHTVAQLIEEKAKNYGLDPRFLATELLLGNEKILGLLNLSLNERDIILHVSDDLEKHLKQDVTESIISMKYDYIQKLLKECVVIKHNKNSAFSYKLDQILTNKYFAFPILAIIMFLIFYLSFGPIGSYLSDLVANLFDFLENALANLFFQIDLDPILSSLILDGIVAGISNVLIFVPTILVLFLFLSILEDSGYMARIAFMMDSVLRKFGLSGKSFVPLLLGFGCNVPAIMATRTLSSKRDRLLTIALIPFMSCGARMPIYALFTSVFFSKNQALIMALMYFISVIVALLSALILNKLLFKAEEMSFIMELPNYRLPSIKNVYKQIEKRAMDFIKKAFTIIFLASIVIWFLKSFDFNLHYCLSIDQSILALLANRLVFIFKPLGFGNVESVTALITGVIAKESVVSTLMVLTKDITKLFNFSSAFSFMIFNLLYVPCVATIAAIKNEVKDNKLTLLIILYQLAVAWIITFIIYNLVVTL